MTPFEVVAILLAGCAAGTINTIVGSGTLITFPTLLAFGIPPVTANVSNTVGLVPGSMSAVVGYRAELVGQRPRLLRLASASLLGSVLGAYLGTGAGRHVLHHFRRIDAGRLERVAADKRGTEYHSQRQRPATRIQRVGAGNCGKRMRSKSAT